MEQMQRKWVRPVFDEVDESANMFSFESKKQKRTTLEVLLAADMYAFQNVTPKEMEQRIRAKNHLF